MDWSGVDYCDVFIRLSFWRHPFTAEHPLLRHWCRDTFLQISDDLVDLVQCVLCRWDTWAGLWQVWARQVRQDQVIWQRIKHDTSSQSSVWVCDGLSSISLLYFTEDRVSWFLGTDEHHLPFTLQWWTDRALVIDLHISTAHTSGLKQIPCRQKISTSVKPIQKKGPTTVAITAATIYGYLFKAHWTTRMWHFELTEVILSVLCHRDHFKP